MLSEEESGFDDGIATVGSQPTLSVEMLLWWMAVCKVPELSLEIIELFSIMTQRLKNSIRKGRKRKQPFHGKLKADQCLTKLFHR